MILKLWIRNVFDISGTLGAYTIINKEWAINKCSKTEQKILVISNDKNQLIFSNYLCVIETSALDT